MNTYLLIWNPDRWEWKSFDKDLQKIISTGRHKDSWSCGVTKSIVRGDRVFLMKLGKKPPCGIMASGRVISEGVYRYRHYIPERRRAGEKANYVDVEFDTIIDPEESIFEVQKLESPPYRMINWTPQASGIQIREKVAGQLEKDWAEFVKIAKFQRDIEDDLEEQKIRKRNIPQTEKRRLIKARCGQGLFRQRVEEIERQCRMTGIKDKRLLVASHIKPWKDSTDEEKLDGNNGLLLSPHVDKLFDSGLISFSDTGRLLCSDDAIRAVIRVWGLQLRKNVGPFNRKQRSYLKFHRSKSFFGSKEQG